MLQGKIVNFSKIDLILNMTSWGHKNKNCPIYLQIALHMQSSRDADIPSSSTLWEFQLEA